jgi:hypothetical protein
MLGKPFRITIRFRPVGELGLRRESQQASYQFYFFQPDRVWFHFRILVIG